MQTLAIQEALSRRTPFVYDIGDMGHIDAPLSNILLDYRPKGFIADQIFPIVPVNKQSDVIPKVDKAMRMAKPSMTVRAPGTEPRYVHFEVSSDTYFAINYALGTFLTREEAQNADVAWRQFNNDNFRRGQPGHIGLKLRLLLGHWLKLG